MKTETFEICAVRLIDGDGLAARDNDGNHICTLEDGEINDSTVIEWSEPLEDVEVPLDESGKPHWDTLHGRMYELADEIGDQ